MVTWWSGARRARTARRADGRFIVGSEATLDLNTGARPTRAVRYGPSGTEYLPDPDSGYFMFTALDISSDGTTLLEVRDGDSQAGDPGLVGLRIRIAGAFP